jgi:hypothetical protein
MARAANSRIRDISCRQLCCPYVRLVCNIRSAFFWTSAQMRNTLFAYTSDKLQKGLSKFGFQSVRVVGFVKPSTRRTKNIYFADIKMKTCKFCQ